MGCPRLSRWQHPGTGRRQNDVPWHRDLPYKRLTSSRKPQCFLLSPPSDGPPTTSTYSSHANGGAGGLSEITHSDSGGVTPINLTESGPSFGTVVGSTYLDGGINPTGNYVRYTRKTDLNFRISSTPAVPFQNNDVSIINGIQIVGVPEPSTALLGIIGGALALFRRKRP
ncbi:MAG: PEP-CTERM sorting domain-containing protein [Akkermansiaceae bacterium]|nr:PEP-CTERM sorting domain-containing protein [Akkermansiaceae bacterium]